MSLAVGVPILEAVYLLGCARWAWKRCLNSGTYDSNNWPEASPELFDPVPRICRIVLAVYEEDLTYPLWPPAGGYRMDPNGIVKKVVYDETLGTAPPYLIYVDHDHNDIVLAIRGLNLGKESDYAVLLNNKLGQEMFDGGYVHHGLLKSAEWLLAKEAETLLDLTQKHPNYTLTFAGHSLGSGVAALATILVAKNKEQWGHLGMKRLRCYAIAPARCMSLNLALHYADIINSIVLQDDFLARTATPLEDIFKSIFCLPCLLCVRCVRDTCTSEKKKLMDPRRLYAPGRMYHVVERKLCRCGRYPPVVKTAVPVEGRFEHIILSCNATSDHSIVWIETECEKALELMLETENVMKRPSQQRMERQETLEKVQKDEVKTALERAVTLNIPNAFSPSNTTPGSYRSETDDEEKAIMMDTY